MTLFRWTATLALVALCSTVGFAQSDQGRLTGSVHDATGAFVGEATVTAKNERTGEERTGMTTTQGVFLIPNLKPSNYTIRVTKSGFAAIEYTQMPIAVGQELSLDFELKP